MLLDLYQLGNGKKNGKKRWRELMVFDLTTTGAALAAAELGDNSWRW